MESATGPEPIPDRDGDAARHVLRLRLRVHVAPSSPRLRLNSARSRPLLGRSIQTFDCNAYDADSLMQVQDNRTFGKALRSRNAHC
jgi:hypothetical protein